MCVRGLLIEVKTQREGGGLEAGKGVLEAGRGYVKGQQQRLYRQQLPTSRRLDLVLPPVGGLA